MRPRESHGLDRASMGAWGVALALLVPLATAGCATGPGHGFGEIVGLTLDARYAPGVARDLGDGWALTDRGYRVRLDRLEVEASSLALEQLAGGGGEVTFDPANPPDGFLLCHGGHCHAEDGSVWSYEEVEAELAGGEDAWSTVVTFDLARGLDLREGAVVEWGACDPSCTLPAADVGRVSLPLEEVSLEATVWDDADGTVAWTVELEPGAVGTLRGALDLPLDRDHDPVLTLGLTAAVDGVLLDGIDLAALQPRGGALSLDADLSAEVIANLETTEIEATVERRPF